MQQCGDLHARGARLGWTQEEIAQVLGVSHDTLLRDTQNSHLGKMRDLLGTDWNEKGIAQVLGVDQSVTSRDMQNSHLGKIHNLLGSDWNEKGIAELATRRIPDFVGKASTRSGVSPAGFGFGLLAGFLFRDHW